MREPRLEDYDPKYKPTKKPQPEAVDLSGVVAIKDKPTLDEPETERNSARSFARPEERTEVRTEVRTEQRSEIRPDFRTESHSGGLPIKRRTKRYSFEFYEDQLVRLKQLKIQAEMAGDGLSLSEMVRVALDAYLEDKTV